MATITREAGLQRIFVLGGVLEFQMNQADHRPV